MILIEKISTETLEIATKLVLELWTNCSFDEEFENCKRIIASDKEDIFLAKLDNDYIGFIYLSLRYEYIEGTSSSPVAYIEGIYIKPDYQKSGIGKRLIELGESWGKAKGAKEYASDTELENEGSIIFHKKVGFKEVNRVVCFAKRIE